MWIGALRHNRIGMVGMWLYSHMKDRNERREIGGEQNMHMGPTMEKKNKTK